MISIVSGTLNRIELLPDLLANTIYASDKVELILVDGGSTDGSINFLKNVKHPNFKLIEVGGRSSYPHFMNLGIREAKYDWICQWNDDVLLVNKWNEVISEIDESDVYIFNWKYGYKKDMNDENWLKGSIYTDGWCLANNTKNGGQDICVNYGIYNKKIFKEIGLYNSDYQYYYCDSDMAYRAFIFGYKIKDLPNIKVCSLNTEKKAFHDSEGENYYIINREKYKNKILPDNLEYL